MGIGYVVGKAYYAGHGTTSPFTALDIASGQVFPRHQSRQRHLEFLQFLKKVDANVPEEFDMHLVKEHYTPRKYIKGNNAPPLGRP